MSEILKSVETDDMGAAKHTVGEPGKLSLPATSDGGKKSLGACSHGSDVKQFLKSPRNRKSQLRLKPSCKHLFGNSTILFKGQAMKAKDVLLWYQVISHSLVTDYNPPVEQL